MKKANMGLIPILLIILIGLIIFLIIKVDNVQKNMEDSLNEKIITFQEINSISRAEAIDMLKTEIENMNCNVDELGEIKCQ